MAVPSWSKQSGIVLTVLEERTDVSITLPLTDTDGVSVALIAGELPPGLRLEGYTIKGVPFEVNKETQFDFVLRASNADGIADRTYGIIIQGADAPVWQTPEGNLAINKSFRFQYWIDTLNTRWGIYETQATTAWTEVDVDIYDSIPPRTTGSNGDYAFVTSLVQFWYKANDRWHRINTTQMQAALGNDITLAIQDSVPNANIDDYWLNTNARNNGFNLSFKYFDEQTTQWKPQKYTVSKTAPITPSQDQVWVQVFDDTFEFVIKVYDSIERTWELLKADYSNTPPDRLNKAYFVIDSSIVDFQLEAIDTDLVAGGSLKYYIGNDGGELPPGLTLTEGGKITGIVDPILALDILDVGGYDTGDYDAAPADFSVVDDNGFDSYFYDTGFYGFAERTRIPRKLNRQYDFIVTVEDEVSSSKRLFSIYVVGDDFLRADNTIMKAATGLFTADNTYLRKPVWITPGNLGVKRAENYNTLYLDIFDPNFLLGQVSYTLSPFNDDGSVSTLPPGMELDGITGEIAGIVPYQPAVSKEYRFTVEALRQEVDTDDVVEVNASVQENVLAGRSQVKLNKLPLGSDGNSEVELLVGQDISIDNIMYTVNTVDSSNSGYDLLNLDRPLEPSYKARMIRTAHDNAIGQNYIYILDEGDGRETAWQNQVLVFNETEKYTLDHLPQTFIDLTTKPIIWLPMVRYTITAADSAGNLELNYGLAGIPETTPFATAIDDYFTSKGYELDIDYILISLTDKQIIFDIARDSTTENEILFQNLFHTDDSVLDNIEVKRSQQFFKVETGLVLQREFNLSNPQDERSGTQLNMGVFKDTLITKKIGVTNTDYTSAVKTFTVTMLGEVDSTVTWITDTDLGTIPANRISYLSLEASTTLAGSNLRYDIVDGYLPNGMELKRDGELTGRPNQFADGTTLGLTSIDSRATTFDNNTTTIDRRYTFKVLARDLFGYGANVKEFTLFVTDTDDKVYSNVYIKPFLTQDQRDTFRNFINDYTIFSPELIYRPYDTNFGLQKDLRTLVYAGIEAKRLENFVASTGLNHRRKNFYFGEIKTALAKQEGSNDIVYEVIYVEIKDPQQPAIGNTNLSVTARSAQNLKINQVQLETKDDASSQETGQDIFTVTMREGAAIKFAATSGVINVVGRSETYDISAVGQLEIVLQDGQIIVVRSTASTTDTSGDPFRFRPKTNPITVDNSGILSSQNQNIKRYISNIGNMRKRIADIGANDRQFLPLWMRSSQEQTGQELDYVTAMPICYCKPGTSQTILENIQNANFDFSKINYEIDRYIVDRTEETITDTFILFRDYKLNV